MVVNSGKKTAEEVASIMIRIAQEAGDKEDAAIAVTMTAHEVRDLGGRKRTSARMEERVGRELQRRGHGRRDGDNFTIFSQTGFRSMSFDEVKELDNDDY